jgi:fatty-acid desaturase
MKTVDKGKMNGTVTPPDNADSDTATPTEDNLKSWVQRYFLNKLMLYGVLQGILTGLVVGGVLSAVMLQSAASEIEAMGLATQPHSAAASGGMNLEKSNLLVT